VSVGAGSWGCSSTTASTAREQFTARLRQPGVHRFDQVSVGLADRGLNEAEAECVADAFERDHWPLEAALGNRVPAKVDVKLVTFDAAACIGTPDTTRFFGGFTDPNATEPPVEDPAVAPDAPPG
jgi:hypothetical protein